MAEDNKKGKTIKDDDGNSFTFDETAEASENDVQVIDVTEEKEEKGKKGNTVTDEERQASLDAPD